MKFTYSTFDAEIGGWRVYRSHTPPSVVVTPQQTPLRLLTEVQISLPSDASEVGVAPFVQGFVAVHPNHLPTQAIPLKRAASSSSDSLLPLAASFAVGLAVGGAWL